MTNINKIYKICKYRYMLGNITLVLIVLRKSTCSKCAHLPGMLHLPGIAHILSMLISGPPPTAMWIHGNIIIPKDSPDDVRGDTVHGLGYPRDIRGRRLRVPGPPGEDNRRGRNRDSSTYHTPVDPKGVGGYMRPSETEPIQFY